MKIALCKKTQQLENKDFEITGYEIKLKDAVMIANGTSCHHLWFAGATNLNLISNVVRGHLKWPGKLAFFHNPNNLCRTSGF